MAKKKSWGLLVILSILAVLITVFWFGSIGFSKESETSSGTKLHLTSAQQLVEMTEVTNDYKIIFSASDSISNDLELAKELSSRLKSEFGITANYRIDSSSEEGAFEILLGQTNRAFSVELMAKVSAASENDNLVWAVAEKDGKIAYLSNSAEAFERGKADFLSFISEDGLSIPKGTVKIHTLSRAEYDEEVRLEQEKIDAEKEQNKLTRIEELKKLIAQFKYEQFGDAPTTSMIGDTYGKPAVYPNYGEHPRVNITSNMIPEILKYMETQEASYTVYEFWKLANTEYDGKLPPATEHTTGRIGFHNMDEKGLAIIEAKAFAYLLTGDELYAYEAIYAMKNFLVTIDIQKIHSDQCREFGRIMYCTAEVYDWCYYLLTEDDKSQFIMACADIGSSSNQNTDFGNQMEVGFPPKLQGCVSGHGSEHQVLRDYLSIAIAIFDEDPTWYEWCGGLVYNYYVEFRDVYFESGTYPQGLNCYAPHRFDADLWSAWLLLCATGEIPYAYSLADVTRSFFQNETPDGSMFGTGDGSRQSNSSAFWHHAIIASALYGAKDLRSHAYNLTKGFFSYSGNTVSFSFSHMLILSASYYDQVGYDTGAVNRFSESEPICYFGSPLGQMTVRSEWNNENVAAVFMKIGERNTANHEHDDQGTFQIFYKGLYTGDTGIYDKYGSTHWSYYHTSTIAHNGLLVFNPAKSGDDPSDPKSYYYSGGQRSFGEANNLDAWMSSTYDTGTVNGAQWSYNSDGTTDYAYLGGDITEAYDTTEVSHISRQMLTLYTDDPDVPMYFIVCDKLITTDASYKKTFLLHSTYEPTIDLENKTVTSVEDGGRLVLKVLLGGDNIEAVGGEGKTFMINGRQCSTNTGNEGSHWGRVEISPDTGSLENDILSFMYVTDSDSTVTVEPELLTAENMNGLVVDDQIIIFANIEDENNSSELKFTTEGSGLKRFIVMGMFSGTWNITVDGMSVAHSVSSEKGGMITFYAPCGEVVISPGKDIAPSNGGRIIYNPAGGIVPDDAPLVYEIGVPVTLPTNIKNGLNKFIGWYTSPSFEEETRVDVLVGTEKGKINLYAKYSGVAVDENYEDIEINSNKISENGISYNGKSGSLFQTVTDENTGNTYLHITRGSADPQIDIGKRPSTYLYGDTKLTLVIDLARDDKTPIDSTCRIRVSSSSDVIPYFSTKTSGAVLLGAKTTVMTLTESFQTLAVTIDFAAGTLTGYDADGNVLATMSISVPASATQSTLTEWLAATTTSVNWWMSTNGESLLIDNFTVYSGEYVPAPVVLPDGYSSIKYVTNGGSFVSAPSKVYKEGEATLLEPNIINGNDDFLGWYTTPDFQKGTIISEIPADASGDFTVYAKWAGKLINADFEGETVYVTEAANGKSDGIELTSTQKEGCIFESKQYSSGNTYIYWYKGSNDPQVKYAGNFGTFQGERIVTFSISLKTVDGETPMAVQYRVRSSTNIEGTTTNSVNLFTTDTSGNVKLGGTTTIATLNSSTFTKIIISMNLDTSEFIAYNEDGTEISRLTFDIPNIDEWISGMSFPMYIYPTGGKSLCFDDIAINVAPYSPVEIALPSTMAKIDYITNGGTLADDAPRYYTKGEAFTLPVPTMENATFLGWFKDAAFSEPITEITAEDTDNFILYAAWHITLLDFNAAYQDVDFTGTSGSTTADKAGQLSIQAKDENCYYKTESDEAGNTYLVWKKGKQDPQVNYGGNLASLAYGNMTLTFSLTFAKNGDSGFVPFQARMCTASVTLPDGTSTRYELNLFKLTADGSLYLANSANSSAFIGQFGEEFKTLHVVADFANGILIGYNENGEKTSECIMTIPAAIGTSDAMFKAVNADIMNIYASGADNSMKIKEITIQTSNIFES